MFLIDWLSGSGHRLSTGASNASGTVRALLPGTQSLSPVFASNGDSITQPVELDAAGRADIYVEGPVDLSFEDSTGAPVQTIPYGNLHGADGVLVENPGFNGTSASGSQGAGGRTYLDNVLSRLLATFGGVDAMVQESGSAVPRLLVELLAGIQLSVKDFGATGDGRAIDTSFIQLALNRCAARGGGVVYVDPGTYLIDSALTVPSGVRVRGAGIGASIIKATGAAQNVFNITSASNISIEALQISHATTSTGTAFSCTGSQRIALRAVSVASGLFAKAVQFDACSNTAIDDSFLGCVSAGANRALLYSTSGNNHFVHNTQFDALTGTCLEMATGASTIGVYFCAFISGAVGVLLTSSDNNDFARVIGCTGLANNVTTPFTEVIPASRMLYQEGNNVDGYSVDVAAAGSHTPTPLTKGPNIRVRATSVGIITINAPATNPIKNGYKMSIHFFNNGGGGITWVMNAIYHMVGAAVPAGTDGHHIVVDFEWDLSATVFREVARGDTT